MRKYFKSLLITLIVTASLTSCSKSDKRPYLIDNPTNEEITVWIDEAEYTIPVESALLVEIEYGKHTLKYKGQSITVFAKSSADKKVIINPTQSNYINYSQLYVVDGTDDETFNSFYEGFARVNGDSVNLEIDGDTVRMFMPIKVYNDLFIEHTVNSWDYSLSDDLPTAATIFSDTGEHYQTSKKKIFREKDFWQFYSEGKYADTDIAIIHPKTAYVDLPRFNPIPPKFEKVQGEKYRAFLQDYIDSYYKWFEKTGSATLRGPKHFDVVKEDTEFNTLKLEYREVYPNDPNFTDACYEYFNQQVGINYRFNFLIID